MDWGGAHSVGAEIDQRRNFQRRWWALQNTNIEEYPLIQGMVSPPQSLVSTEFHGAPDNAYAPTPGPNPETVTGAGL